MFKLILNKYKLKVNDSLNSYFKNLLSKNYIGILNKKMVSNIRDFINNGGKRIRPVFLTLAYLSKKKEELQKVIDLSISLELLHNGTLIHDDIMDNSDLRRGSPSFHIEFQNWYDKKSKFKEYRYSNLGLSMAILGGDALMTLGLLNILSSSYSEIIKNKLSEIYSRSFVELIEGQALDIELAFRNTTLEEYNQMISGKTASLFRASIEMGCLLSGASKEYTKNFVNYANSLGYAFQIQDDILGTFGDVKKFGKPIDSDIKEGKSTILTIYAKQKANKEQLNILNNVLGNQNSTEEDIEKVREIFLETGAKDFASNEARKWLEKARYYLSKLNLSGEPKEFFEGAINYMLNREV